MKPTPEFRKFCLLLHQDVIEMTSSLDGMISYALGGLSADEQQRLAKFISSLSSSRVTDDDIAALWDHGGSDLDVGSTKDVRKFLDEVLRNLHLGSDP